MTSFLERLTDLEAKATRGRWESGTEKRGSWRTVSAGPIPVALLPWSRMNDAALIIFLRNAVPEVKALIEAAQELKDGERDSGDALMGVYVALDALNRLEVNHG